MAGGSKTANATAVKKKPRRVAGPPGVQMSPRHNGNYYAGKYVATPAPLGKKESATLEPPSTLESMKLYLQSTLIAVSLAVAVTVLTLSLIVFFDPEPSMYEQLDPIPEIYPLKAPPGWCIVTDGMAYRMKRIKPVQIDDQEAFDSPGRAMKRAWRQYLYEQRKDKEERAEDWEKYIAQQLELRKSYHDLPQYCKPTQ